MLPMRAGSSMSRRLAHNGVDMKASSRAMWRGDLDRITPRLSPPVARVAVTHPATRLNATVFIVSATFVWRVTRQRVAVRGLVACVLLVTPPREPRPQRRETRTRRPWADSPPSLVQTAARTLQQCVRLACRFCAAAVISQMEWEPSEGGRAEVCCPVCCLSGLSGLSVRLVCMV